MQVLRHHAGLLHQREHVVRGPARARWRPPGGRGLRLSVPVLQREREAVEDGRHGAPGRDQRHQSRLPYQTPHGFRRRPVRPHQRRHLHSPSQCLNRTQCTV